MAFFAAVFLWSYLYGAKTKSRARSLELLHSSLYAIAAVYLLRKNRIASIPLGMDLLLGCGVFSLTGSASN